jgi:hypothetical protein
MEVNNMKLRHHIALISAIAIIVLGFATSVQAQKKYVQKSGVIQSIAGEVFLDGKPVPGAQLGYLKVKNGQVLSTRKGYVELMLYPTAYLLLGENASLKMQQNDLINMQFEINQGSTIAYIMQDVSPHPIKVQVSNSFIELKRRGFYRFESNPGELKVYEGTALVKYEMSKIRMNKGRRIHLDAQSTPEKFDIKSTDVLQQLAMQRASKIAAQIKYPVVTGMGTSTSMSTLDPEIARRLNPQTQADREKNRQELLQIQQLQEQRQPPR